MQVGPSSVEICYNNFQDGSRCGAILPVLDGTTSRSFSDVSFYQQTKFRSYNSVRG